VCGMPQLKAGWMVACGPAPARAELGRGLEWLADLFLSVNGPVQHALPRLLAGRERFQSRVRARLAANLAALRACVARHPVLTWPAGAGGWVTLLRLPGTRGEEEWTLELLRHDVAVHPGHFYDTEGGAFVVLSLIVEPAVFAAGLERLASLLDA
jgi:alanine-synthesizing transaminase